MRASLGRIGALFYRHVSLHRRNLIRSFDIFFWPVMDLLIWGFLTLYLQDVVEGPAGRLMLFLIGALISWDIHYRGQLAVSIALIEEIWTRNLVNIVLAPLRLWEWVAAVFLFSALKVAVITVLLAVIAHVLYGFTIVSAGWVFALLAANLLVFGWAIGLLTSGLLLRFGYAAEALIWGVPFLIQPFSCVFYPLSALPAWAQPVARVLPSTYVFEALRTVLRGEAFGGAAWAPIVALNAGYLLAGTVCLTWMLRRARLTGRLGRVAQD